MLRLPAIHGILVACADHLGRPRDGSHMSVLTGDIDIDIRSSGNREALLDLLQELETAKAAARAGGGERYVRRHQDRGRLLPRARIELLVDQDAPLLELSPIAGWGTDYPVGASVVTAVGVVEDRLVVMIAHDPTVRGGGVHKLSLEKQLRALAIARENRLPVIYLVESAGGDLPSQAETFTHGGGLFRELTQLSASGVTTIALVFGNATAGGAYVPGMCDYVVMIQEQSHAFLGGPPLVKMATGEESSAEELGGAQMHASVSGLADYLAANEHDCLRIGREIVSRIAEQPGETSTSAISPPLYDAEELLDLASVDLRRSVSARSVISRVVDGSEFSEFKPLYGANLVTGFAKLHGHPIGILANERGVLFSQEAHKATQFIQLANQSRTPLIFIQNTNGFMVGAAYERGGIVKDGAKMINAVSNSTVPHVTLIIGAAYGAGHYAMCGRAYRPRFLFTWPNARSSIMGPQQLAGVMSIISRQSAKRSDRAFDEAADEQRSTAIEEQIEHESHAFFNSGRLHDDGVIDPRDTRTVLGLALSVCRQAPPTDTAGGYGVFRM
jgi:acetyl-CoA carboxylase carboxyltransferase component